MRIECIVRCAPSGDRSWTLALCPKGKATFPASALVSAFTISPLRSLLRPTYCSWFVTAQKNLHRPVLVDLWANTETLRSCEPASPTSRRSAPRAASTGRLRDPLSSSCASASFGRDPLETRASVGDPLKSVWLRNTKKRKQAGKKRRASSITLQIDRY